MKRPAFQFYPADWRKDSALQSCSIAAQGLWVNMLCIAHECDPYGHLSVNGKPMVSEQLARLVGLPVKECSRYLEELESAGVYSANAEGVIYSRRMVLDEIERNKRAAGGALGAEHGTKGGIHGSKGGRPRGVIKPPLEPPPSSSSSSSSSERALPQIEISAATAMAVELRRKGLKVNGAHPTLQAWCNDGFSLPAVLEAYAIARMRKPEPEEISPNYLDPILRTPPKKAEPAWWASEQRIIAKGVELGISPRPGEEMQGFRERIQTEMAKRKVSA